MKLILPLFKLTTSNKKEIALDEQNYT